MAAAAKKKTALERRLKRIDQEAGLVRADIKTLSRAIRRSEEDVDWDRLKTVSRPRRPVPEKAPSPEATSGFFAKSKKQDVDLFNWSRRPEGETAQGEPRAPDAAEAGPAKERAFEPDARFANYLTAGSFTAARPLRQERAVLRNKAIFMIVVVVVVGFVVFKLVF